ncbi:MAG: glycosyl hydrolase 53 family protein [Bacteroidales bacterium]|nr:glycosyl hydrolase 53 family protein [Bacteroidales bacterium]
MNTKFLILLLMAQALLGYSCSDKNPDHTGTEKKIYTLEQFCMGADLSYTNEIEDHGGIYKDSSVVRDPFQIFRSHGCNLVRVRLWNNPMWTKEVYGASGTQMYSDLQDVVKTMQRAAQNGMAVSLDLHYSDTWADPEHQVPPAAWNQITAINVLEDSIYNFTFRTLTYLKGLGLIPRMVQVGNEINCGMMMTGTPDAFPKLNVCNGNWVNQGKIINAGIKAVRDASVGNTVDTKVILHVADPKNVEWWIDNIKKEGAVTDFDIVGISYYPLWHTEIPYSNVPGLVAKLKGKYAKEIMIVETAYPWTTEGNDSFNNLFGSQQPVGGFPFTKQGQKDFMVDMTQKLMNAGCSGIMVWEPGWITSGLKTQWGTGSAWENSAFFDFEGSVLPGMDFMNHNYTLPSK